MNRLENMGKVVETDVLVIGGGPSGLWAANHASEFVDRVLIVDKGPRDWGGLASAASGGYVAVLRGDSVKGSLQDVIYFYDGLCQQDLWETILTQAVDRLEDYQKLGVEFFSKEGKLWGLLEHGLDYLTLYTASPFPHGGKRMVEALLRESNRLNVKRISRTVITDLLTSDGNVAGAVGFNTLSGRFYIFKAKAVILATGGAGWKTNMFGNIATGEGLAMAFRSGAELTNCEYAGTLIAPKLFAWEGLSNLVPLGGKFINAKGESFMEKYSPFGSNTDDTFIFLAMVHEARAGRGPFYMDCRPIKQEDRALVTPTHGWMDLNYRKLQAIDMDLLNKKVEWVPMVTGLKGAAIAADVKGKTTVPGFFVCGRARSYAPTNYLNGSSLSMTAVTGYITGETVGKYAATCKLLSIDEDEVMAFKRNLYAPVGKEGIPPKEIFWAIQETVFPYDVCMLKNELSLKKALTNIEKIKQESLPLMGAKDPHYLMKSLEVRAITELTELFLKASLMRTESRAGHFREDYPDRNNKNWLSWILFSRDGEEIKTRIEPVPYDRYRYKATRFYSDNFNFAQ